MALLFAPLLWGVKRAEAAAIELKMAHFMSPMHIQHQRSFVPFAKKVEELTGGKVKIRIYPGGALGGPKQLPDAVKAGITDIAFIIPGYSTGRFPRISAFDLPFLFDSADAQRFLRMRKNQGAKSLARSKRPMARKARMNASCEMSCASSRSPTIPSAVKYARRL